MLQTILNLCFRLGCAFVAAGTLYFAGLSIRTASYVSVDAHIELIDERCALYTRFSRSNFSRSKRKRIIEYGVPCENIEALKARETNQEYVVERVPYALINYRGPSGEPLVATRPLWALGALGRKAGDTIQIRYVPDRPADIDRPERLWYRAPFGWVLGTGLAMFGVWYVFAPNKLAPIVTVPLIDPGPHRFGFRPPRRFGKRKPAR